MEASSNRRKHGRPLTPEEVHNIGAGHAEVAESLNLAIAVFLRGEERVARQLVKRKTLVWEMEANATDRYFQHMRETSGRDGPADDFNLRVLRDLKRIHSLIAALAYPILDRAGHLQNPTIEMPAAERSEAERSQPETTHDRDGSTHDTPESSASGGQ